MYNSALKPPQGLLYRSYASNNDQPHSHNQLKEVARCRATLTEKSQHRKNHKNCTKTKREAFFRPPLCCVLYPCKQKRWLGVANMIYAKIGKRENLTIPLLLLDTLFRVGNILILQKV
jgi:hypothetical protein